jgi:hypothetical protein
MPIVGFFISMFFNCRDDLAVARQGTNEDVASSHLLASGSKLFLSTLLYPQGPQLFEISAFVVSIANDIRGERRGDSNHFGFCANHMIDAVLPQHGSISRDNPYKCMFDPKISQNPIFVRTIFFEIWVFSSDFTPDFPAEFNIFFPLPCT